MGKFKLSLNERFPTKYNIVESGCWEWNGALRADGYGILKVNGKCLGAHRYAYELYKGKIPIGLNVLHACDNRKCINPEHLFVGTQLENLLDCIKKDRRKIVKQERLNNEIKWREPSEQMYDGSKLNFVRLDGFGLYE